jgi:hypothetical protein
MKKINLKQSKLMEYIQVMCLINLKKRIKKKILNPQSIKINEKNILKISIFLVKLNKMFVKNIF